MFESTLAATGYTRYAVLLSIAVLFALLYLNRNDSSNSSIRISKSLTQLYKNDQCQEDELKLIRTACCSQQDLPVLGGVDVVDLFGYENDQHIPLLGNPSIAALLPTRVGSFKFLFTSEENRAKFLTNPWQYAPAWGGFCAMGIGYESQYFQQTSRDRLGPNSDLSTWTIVNGRLYFFGGEGPKIKFLEALPDAISYGDAHWSNMFGGVFDGHFNTNCFHRQEFFDTIRGIKTPTDDGRNDKLEDESPSPDDAEAENLSDALFGHTVVRDDEGTIVEVDGVPVAKVKSNPVDTSLYTKYAADKSLWNVETEKVDPTENFLSKHEIIRDENGQVIMVDGIPVISFAGESAFSELNEEPEEEDQVSDRFDPLMAPWLSLIEKQYPESLSGGFKKVEKYTNDNQPVMEVIFNFIENDVDESDEAPEKPEEIPIDEQSLSQDVSIVEKVPERVILEQSPSQDVFTVKVPEEVSLNSQILEDMTVNTLENTLQEEAATVTVSSSPQPINQEVDPSLEETPADSSVSVSSAKSEEEVSFAPNEAYELGQSMNLAEADAEEVASDGKTAGHRVVYCPIGKECGVISKNLYKDDLKMISNILLRDSIESGNPASSSKNTVFVPNFPIIHLEHAPVDESIFTTSKVAEEDVSLLKELLGADVKVSDHIMEVSAKSNALMASYAVKQEI
jgi:hypothetical protein